MARSAETSGLRYRLVGIYLPVLGLNLRLPVPPNLSKKSRAPTGSQAKMLPPQ